MKRRRLIIGSVFAVIAMIAFTVYWQRTHSPCLVTFKKVQPGMTRAEVYDTVGGPPGNYTGGSVYFTPDPKWEFWAARDSVLFVAFDTNDIATEVAAAPAIGHYSGGPSFFKRVTAAFPF